MMNFQARDGRANPVQVPNGFASSLRFTRTKKRDAVDRARNLLWIESTECLWFYRGVLLLVAATSCAVMLRSWRHEDWSLALRGSVIPLLVICTCLLHRRVLAEVKKQVRRTCGPMPPVCAACEYDLHGLAPEADGCTVCPECGAAWRVGG